MRWLVISIAILFCAGVGADEITTMQHNLISKKDLDIILERIAEIDESSKLNNLIDKILIEDRGAAVQRRRKVVIIDSGHGGKDPGTTGVMGTIEKELTLQYGILLAKTLRDAGYTVFMTRTSDNYISLIQRRKFAQDYNGSLMISLHADSAGTIEARGLSVYTLSEEATDETAKKLASAHDDSDITFKSHVRDDDALSVLINVAQNATVSKSEYFAKIILKHAQNGRLFIIPNPHRKAGFAVLKMPDVPSVLIELGFLSSPEEEILLRSPPYRNQMIQTLFKSIDEFFGISVEADKS